MKILKNTLLLFILAPLVLGLAYYSKSTVQVVLSGILLLAVAAYLSYKYILNIFSKNYEVLKINTMDSSKTR